MKKPCQNGVFISSKCTVSLSSKIVFIRSLNYQWQLDDYSLPYYHAGKDLNNFHFSSKEYVHM